MAEIGTAPSRLAERVIAAPRAAGTRLLLAGVAVALVAAGGALVYATGGTQHAWLHLLYVPVLLAAWGFGAAGGIVAGVAAGLIVGPLMPVDVAGGIAQQSLNWLYRLGFFVLIGGVAGGLNELLRFELRAAHRLRRRFASLVEHAPDLIIVCDEHGRVRYASPSLASVLGYSPERIEGTPLSVLVHPDEQRTARQLLGLESPARAHAELRMCHEDGSWRSVELGQSPLPDTDLGVVVLNGRDATPRRAMEAELRHQASHDPATGLPNRRKAADVAKAALTRDGGTVAVLLIDLERSRRISEAFGPDIRDRLVTAVAQRLEPLLGRNDLLARYETSELAVVCPDALNAATVQALGEQLLAACDPPVVLLGREIHVRAHIGVAIATAARHSGAEQLFRDASIALRHWDASPTRRVQIFEPAWRAAAVAEHETEEALHGALTRDELVLHYQPVMSLRTGCVTGVEALLRWQHPRLGMVPPGDFVPLAEQTGTIVPIGRWVLREACAQLATWRRELQAPQLHMAVNLSARQLEVAELADDVRDALRAAGLPPDALTLELTETTLFDHTDHTLEALIALHGLGVRLAVDDFGTGYSSLGYLKRLPVDVLKIDRTFVQQLDDTGDDAIISAIIGLAHSLGLDTIAEGVEDCGHASRLVALGCDHAQGFHYARPQPAEEAAATIARLLPADRIVSLGG